MAEWKFDEAAAQVEGGGGGNSISESGVYYGVFTEAVLFTTSNGARGVEFSFEESNTGRKTRYIRVITRKITGEKSFGFGMINALMGLLKLKSISDEQVGEDKNGNPIFGLPALCEKHIGVMLQREEYWKSNDELGWKMNVVNFIDARTNKTYNETANNKDATAWKQKISDRAPRGERPKQGGGETARGNPASTAGDDLPF